VLVVVVLVAAGAGYGYLQYRWGQVATAPCTSCATVADGAPYNVLVVGSDSREGETAAEAQQFGDESNAAGQRSDTIKVIHVDPATGTASVLSIPRDTFVTITGLPAGTGIAADNKINASFNNGPDALIQTIQATFGIPINHYIVVNFFGLQDAVDALGGISLDFPYPVRDSDDGNNNSGLSIPTAGCQVLDGSQALSLSRSRYYQYEVDGVWHADPTSDIGRIERQNIIMEAVLDKGKSTINPIRLNSLLGSVVHDFTVDDGLTPEDLLALATRYHAFSGSDLVTYTLPTTGGTSPYAGDVEVVSTPAAQQMITTFLGTDPDPVTTPPLDADGQPQVVPAVASASASGATTAAAPATSSAASTAAPTTATTAPAVPSYDPTRC